MIQETLRNKYHDCLTGWALTDKGKKIPAGLDIYENKSSIVVPRIVIKEECKENGVGTKIMNDLIAYADNNKQIIALTPSSDFGGNKNRLIQFYKRFGFKHNNGI
jgi:predicted GNAT family N-acyltransferase